MPSRHSSDTPAPPQHDPREVARERPTRDVLIDDVSRELKRRHGGNDVLNRLEAEILVDHFIEHHANQQNAPSRSIDVAEIIRQGRYAST